MTLDKNRTYSPKEALDADPNWPTPVKLGRGRMPQGGDAHCRALAAAGYRIKGYDVTAATKTATSSSITPAEPVVRKVTAANVKEVKEYTILWPEDSFKAVGVKDKKEWGMREVCNTCRVSLVQNQCENPTILGNIPVKIVPR